MSSVRDRLRGKWRIIETGTHAELLNREGIYSQLHRLQFAV